MHQASSKRKNNERENILMASGGTNGGETFPPTINLHGTWFEDGEVYFRNCDERNDGKGWFQEKSNERKRKPHCYGSGDGRWLRQTKSKANEDDILIVRWVLESFLLIVKDIFIISRVTHTHEVTRVQILDQPYLIYHNLLTKACLYVSKLAVCDINGRNV